METAHQSIETGVVMVAKAAPPVSVSLATVAGFQVNEILLWATLIYTTLMICHKVYAIITEINERKALNEFREKYGEQRLGASDIRRTGIERRKKQSKDL